MNYWTRKDYEDYLVVLADEDDFCCRKGCLRELGGAYPKRAPDAVAELRTRGIDINYTQIRYWGKITDSPRLFSAEMTDAIAADLAAKGELTPAAQVCSVLNIDYHQCQMALLQAGRESGMLAPGDPSAFVMAVRPGCPGRGICGVVTFTAPVAEGKQ